MYVLTIGIKLALKLFLLAENERMSCVYERIANSKTKFHE